MIETGSNSWNGIKVRKDDKEGVVIVDNNYNLRVLTVEMNDGTLDKIVMNNRGDDPEETQEWEWLSDRGSDKDSPKWYRF